MGSFFKTCGDAESRWPRCPHEYTIRYRNAAGRQVEESGFSTSEKAKTRLAEIYQERKYNPHNQRRAERLQKYGPMQFHEYAAEWRKSQRALGPASLRHLDSLLENHLLPAFASRRMGTFDYKVVDGFIITMERNGVGLATQSNVFDKLRAILLDAHRLGLYDESPVEGIVPPQYDPKRAVIPSPQQLAGLRLAGDAVFRVVADLMSGCGLRNGEALAVNVNNIVANDVYRITEQVNQTTGAYAPLKHRKPGEYRDVPLPARTKHTIEWYADTYGTVDGYLLRHPRDLSKPMPTYHLQNQWQRLTPDGTFEIPEGMVLYGFRHFFASNCLTHNIPITDVAEWMGHRSIDVTFKIYRHLMPGSISRAAEVLNLDLAA
ncbi:site-specific integrase [Kitasatospora sp. CB02891]|uniref:tyrosine-type recombinase/integrase n=1 Tax=Kitasatospora sp. CB02891 TaxID=2020329 RepID=UPI000C2700C2|nr:site-specific integrase [Kitasatospora sp. CB02891]PJN25670.1 site-specific integrase [Kitasatospora sp. CB02891]